MVIYNCIAWEISGILHKDKYESAKYFKLDLKLQTPLGFLALMSVSLAENVR